MVFSDRAPAHVTATAARKILTRTASGYRETLELEHQGDEHEVYSSIELYTVRKNGQNPIT